MSELQRRTGSAAAQKFVVGIAAVFACSAVQAVREPSRGPASPCTGSAQEPALANAPCR